MTKPLISIIVPVYNSEKFLSKCVTSLLNQTFSDFELLLINDGSQDSSGNICEANAKLDSRIRVFHKANGGVSSARNFGIQNAEGEFLCFVDSDDWVKEDFLANFGIQEYDADFYVQGYLQVTHMDSSVKKVGFSHSGYHRSLAPFEYGFSKLLFNGPCGKLYRRHLIENAKLFFYEKLSYGEDTIFVLSYISLVQSISVSDSCSYIYECRPGSLTYRFVDFYDLQYLAHETRRLHSLLIWKWKLSDSEHMDAVYNSFFSYFIASMYSLCHYKSAIKGHQRSVEFAKCVKYILYNKSLFERSAKTAYKATIFRLLMLDIIGKEVIFRFLALLRFLYLDKIRRVLRYP